MGNWGFKALGLRPEICIAQGLQDGKIGAPAPLQNSFLGRMSIFVWGVNYSKPLGFGLYGTPWL